MGAKNAPSRGQGGEKMYPEKYLVQEQPRESRYTKRNPKQEFIKTFIYNFILSILFVIGVCCINALVEIIARAL